MNPATLVAGHAPLCEACKWASMSHQPVSGPSTVPLDRGGTAGLLVQGYSGSQASLGQASRVVPRSGNTTNSVLCALAMAVVTGSGLYAFTVWTDHGPWWMFLLLGLGIGNAAVIGNDRLLTSTARWVGGCVSLATATAATYFVYRHAAIVAQQRQGINSRLSLVLTWKQITFLFGHGQGWSWWLLVGIAGAAGACPTIRWTRKLRR